MRSTSAPQLAFADRYLTVWILLAMVVGVLLGATGLRLSPRVSFRSA